MKTPLFPGKVFLLVTLFLLSAMLATDCRRFIVRRIFISKKLEGINLSGLDFYNTNLEKINLTRARLVKTNFSFCNLRNSRFINADLREADLGAANLTGADLRGANLRNANLKNAVFKKANLAGVYFYDASLVGADMRDAIMVIGAAEGADMSVIMQILDRNGLVQYAHFRGADFTGAAVSGKWKNFIKQQGVKNYDRIIWAK